MSSELPEPERWVDRPARDASAESAVGTAFRRVRQATEPSEAAVESLARRLRAPRRRTSRGAFVWSVAAAAVVLLSMCGFVGAAYLIRRWRVVEARPVTPVAAPIERGTHRRGPRAVASADAPAAIPEAPSVAAPPVIAPPASEPPRRGPEPRGRAAAPPDEADLLASVFRALRSQGDPAAALRALDDYDRRFPGGALRSEARTARAEAFMAQDRRHDAFLLLAAISEDDDALTRNVRATRGELYAEAGRCADAVRDFERVLVVADDDALGGRALYGRASCRLRAGEIDGARADLSRYLALHADGPFAPAARRALGSTP